MKKLKRISIKISFTTILFFLISLVSLTFAWFCYSSVAKANMELEVLAWNIDYAGDQTTINVQVDDVKPGMDEYSRDIDVTNNGDVDAKLSYKIKKIRVFDDEYTASTDSEMQEIIDSFPFDIDISITSSIVATSHTEKYIITVNWDFEGNSSSVDTEWGKNSNDFYEQEKALHDEDSSYVIRKPLEIEMELISIQASPVNFTIEGRSYQVNEGDTWSDWLLATHLSSYENSEIWVTYGCGDDDSYIRTHYSTPYNQDTRANNQYCALYLQSSRPSGGGAPQKRMVNSVGVVQTVSDIIDHDMNYVAQGSSSEPVDECCFDKGTKITMANGKLKNIEDVKKGEYVLTYNYKTKMYEPNKVTREIVKHNSDDLVYLNLSNGTRIGMRAYHPFLTNSGYKSLRPKLAETIMEAGYDVTQLNVGDKLIGLYGNPKVISIEKRKPIANYDTYNLSVENNHNYIANGVVVHNAGCSS